MNCTWPEHLAFDRLRFCSFDMELQKLYFHQNYASSIHKKSGGYKLHKVSFNLSRLLSTGNCENIYLFILFVYLFDNTF